MPSRKARISASARRQQIVRVATRLFARQGFSGTTTHQIARRARVSEAIIFRHFPSKADLYWTIIEEKCRAAGARDAWDRLLNGRGENADREVFAAIAEDILSRSAADPGLMRLLFFTALENHQLSHKFFRMHLSKRYEAVAEYIRERVEQGTFRRVDPLVAARGFLGTVVDHFLIQELFGGKRYQKLDPHRVSRTLADIWVTGMQAEKAGAGRNGKKRALAAAG